MTYIILVISILFTVSAQLLLKKGVIASGKLLTSSTNLFSLITGIFKNIYLVSGLVLWGVAFLCWLFVLSKIKLNIAYPLANALNISLVVLGSVLFFKENFSLAQSLGLLLIIGGIFMLWRI